jgi:hypothetical protein
MEKTRTAKSAVRAVTEGKAEVGHAETQKTGRRSSLCATMQSDQWPSKPLSTN